MSKVITVRIDDKMNDNLQRLFATYEKKVGVKVNKNAFYVIAILKYAEEHIDALERLP